MPSLISLLAKLVSCLSRSKKASGNTMFFKNHDIFPPRSRKARDLHDISYQPDNLLTRITNSDAVRGVGHIYVSSAQYCKETKDAEHEFLVFEVKVHVDGVVDSRKNLIMIDRVPKVVRNRPPQSITDVSADERAALGGVVNSSVRGTGGTRSRGGVVSSAAVKNSITSGTRPASDLCYVSAGGSIAEFTSRLNRTPYDCLSTMRFRDNSFTLEKLLILADVISDHREAYALFKTQCYWYAYMLWRMVQRISGADAEPFGGGRAAGTHRYVPWLINHSRADTEERKGELAMLQRSFEKEWNNFERDELPALRREYMDEEPNPSGDSVDNSQKALS